MSLFTKMAMKKIMRLALAICLSGSVYAEDERSEEEPRLREARHRWRDRLLSLEEMQADAPEDEGLKNEIEHAKTEFHRINEEIIRLTNELERLQKKLQNLRKRQAESPDDKGVADEMQCVKNEYHHKIKHYNSVTIPRSKLIYEGDMPPENMPWDRTDGGAVSVFIRHRDKVMQVSDEEAVEVRSFLDDHAFEWIRGNQYATEGMLNQIVFAGSVTICKENGYSRTYTIVHGEGLRWCDCYLPLSRGYSDPRFDTILSRYIKDVSKLPLDPGARQ